MVFGFFKKKPQPVEKVDPMATFDALITSLERQGAEVRRSAATLLAVRAELNRDRQRLDARAATTEGKLSSTIEHDGARTTLERDQQRFRLQREKLDAAIAEADRDAQLLLETAEQLGRELAELKDERTSARARLSAGLLVSDALKARAVSFDRLMKLDAARDEVERARALADLYREEQGG